MSEPIKIVSVTAASILDTLNATVGWLRAGSDSVTSDELLGSGEAEGGEHLRINLLSLSGDVR